jgi:hypothetical protein
MEISELLSTLEAQETSKSPVSEQSMAIIQHKNLGSLNSESFPTSSYSVRERNLLIGQTVFFIYRQYSC